MLWGFDLPIDLGQTLFTAHGQHRVPEADQNRNCRNARSDRSLQPPKCLVTEMQVRQRWCSNRLEAIFENRQYGPDEENYHHHCGDLHDPQGLRAGERNANSIGMPEIENDQNAKSTRKQVGRDMHPPDVKVLLRIIDECREVQSCAYGADWSSQNVVKQQCRNGKLCRRATHRFPHYSVHPSSHEHAATLDVNSTHCIREEHYGQYEPRSRFTDCSLGDASDVID